MKEVSGNTRRLWEV